MTPKVERTPPYMQVVQHYRKRINEGDLRDGDRLPPVRQIAKEWGLAHATAARVIATLRGDGLAESTPGVGTVVRSRVYRNATDRALRMLTTGRIYAPNERAVIRFTGLSPAPDHIAAILGIAPGCNAARRDRVTHDETGPVSASTSWFHPDLVEAAPDILSPDRIPGGTPSVIEAATGRRTCVIEERRTVGRATPDQAGTLGVEVGTPVLIGLNVYRDTNGDPIEVGESVAGPGRWTYTQYEVTSE